MKNKVNYQGLGIFPAVGVGIITFAAIGFFLRSNLVELHRGTTEGGVIAGIGVLLIIVVSAISITTLFLINRYQKQREK